MLFIMSSYINENHAVRTQSPSIWFQNVNGWAALKSSMYETLAIVMWYSSVILTQFLWTLSSYDVSNKDVSACRVIIAGFLVVYCFFVVDINVLPISSIHWDRSKMAAVVSRATLSDTFYWMNVYLFKLSLITGVQLAVSQHWLK